MAEVNEAPNTTPKKNYPKRILIALLFLIVALVIARIAITTFSSPPATIGITNGKLSPLPNKPNCVSSQTDQTDKQVKPLSYKGELAAAKKKLKECLSTLPRTTIHTEKENYLHIETRSLLMGYPDDTEFYFDETQKKIHIRAASRLGHSDFGVNRKRVELIQNLFNRE